MDDYEASIGVALFVSWVGWIAAIGGVVLSLWLVNEGDLALLALPSAITVALVGFLLVVGAEASRAVMESAGYSKEMLELMRKNAE